jgi:hypothetical protein
MIVRKRQRLFFSLSNINRLAFVIEAPYGVCEVGTEFLNIVILPLGFKGPKTEN